MNYTDLINKIAADIVPGLSKGISAEKLKELFTEITQFANETRGDYQGSAAPADDPGTPTDPVYYIAESDGTYSNFGGLTVTAADGLNILSFIPGTGWSKTVVPIDLGSYAEVSDISVYEIQTDEPIDGFYKGRNDNAPVASAAYQYLYLAVPSDRKVKISTVVTGTAISAAVYMNGSTYISSEQDASSGVDLVVEDLELTIPPTCTHIYINCKSTETISIQLKNIIDFEAQKELNLLLTELVSEKLDKTDYSIFTDQVIVPVSGFYKGRNDNEPVASAAYQYLYLAVPSDRKVKISTVVTGIAISAAVYMNGSTYISSEEDADVGVDLVVEDLELTIPPTCTHIYINCKSTGTINLQLKDIINAEVQAKSIKDLKLESDQNNYWKDKSIVWFGTSIPASGAELAYPIKVGSALGATITNESVGSSMARIGTITTNPPSDPYGWIGLNWQNVSRSLAMNLVEKQYLIDNWETWKTILTGTPPDTLSVADQDFFKDCSYENKLVSRHLGINRKDLYVFDHGHNDNNAGDLDAVPVDKYDRNYYIGAMAFLFKLILEDNPRARIAIISHYEDARKTIITEAQKIVAEQWDFPYLELFRKLGWTQQEVTTTGYWQDSTTWIPSGGASQTLTITEVWLQDDLHPESEPARELIAGVISNWMRTIR